MPRTFNSPDALLRFSGRRACVLGLLLLLGACGYKGPLSMPPPPAAPDASLTTPPASDPADASQSR